MSHPPSIWRASLTSPPSDDLRAIIAEYVELQRNYLRNPLPVSPSICPVCRGVRSTGYPLCFPCWTHRERGSGALADIVLPVSYSPRNGQHHHNLRTYKTTPPSQRARRDLPALLLHFLHRHLPCVSAQIGGPPTYAVTVPSTSGRAGPHPLTSLIGSRLGMPTIATRSTRATDPASESSTPTGSPLPYLHRRDGNRTRPRVTSYGGNKRNRCRRTEPEGRGDLPPASHPRGRSLQG